MGRFHAWNAKLICGSFKIPCLMGRLRTKGVLENLLKGPIITFGSLVEYYLVSAKDQPRIHQFEKKVFHSIFSSNVAHLFLRQRPHSFVVSSERGPAEPRSTDSKSRRRRDRDRRSTILQAQARSYVLKRLLWHRPRDDVAGARIKTGRDCACGYRQWNGQHQVGGQWDGLGTEPYGGDDEHRKWRPSQYHSCLPYAFKMDEYGETEGKHIYQKNGLF